jgi:hypothetical protein
MRRSPQNLSALTLLVLTALAGPSRAGDETPYKGAFNFAVINVTPVSDTEVLVKGSLDGNATHLGRFTGQVQYYVDLQTGKFVGTLFKVAANGDQIYESLTGQFTATGSVGSFVLTGGTGRFENATGGGTFVSTWVIYPSTAVVAFKGTTSNGASN